MNQTSGLWKDGSAAENFTPKPYLWMEKNIQIRSLDPAKDEYFYLKAYDWQFDKPRWYRESMRISQKTKAEYLNSAQNEAQLDFAVFNGSLLIGLITLVEIAPSVFDSHIDAPRSTDIEDLIFAAIAVRNHAFSRGATKIVTYTATVNKPILAMCRRVGFVDTNVRIIWGNIGSRLVEWREAVIIKEFYS